MSEGREDLDDLDTGTWELTVTGREMVRQAQEQARASGGVKSCYPRSLSAEEYRDAAHMVRIREEMYGRESVRIEKRKSIETGLPVYHATFQIPTTVVRIPQDILGDDMSRLGPEWPAAELRYLKENLHMAVCLAVDAAVQRLWERRDVTEGRRR